MISNYAKGALLFATIYSLVLALSIGLAIGRPAAMQANPQVAKALVTNPTTTTSSFNVGILVLELLIVSAVALAEMKFGAISRIYNFIKDYFKDWHPLLIDFMLICILLGFDYLIFVFLGFAWFIFLTINGGGILFIMRLFLYKAPLREIMPVAVTFLSFFVLWPYSLLFFANTTASLVLMEFLYLPLAFFISAMIMRHPTKNRINAVAFSFSVLLPPFIGTLFTPWFAIILLAIFSLYDFGAVFLTKHMQFMAARLLSWNVPEAFLIGDIDLINKRLEGLKTGQDPTPLISGIQRPLIFGAGDAILPSIVISSFVFADLPKFAVLTVFGCITGVLLNLFVLSKRKQVLPALPLIFACVLAAIALAAL